jgi:hypothetical protein
MRLETLRMLQEVPVGSAERTSGLRSGTPPGRYRAAKCDRSPTRTTVAGSSPPEPSRIGERGDFGDWAAAVTDAVEERRDLSRTARPA